MQGASDVEQVCLPFRILAGIKRSWKTQTGWGGREQNCHWKWYSVLCVRGIWRETGPCRIYQGIFYFLFFEDVIHSSTETLSPHNVRHPGAICGQGINFFPCVRRPLASCVEAKCLSSEIISWESGLRLSVTARLSPGDIYFIWGPASGRRCRSISCIVNEKLEHSPLARRLSLSWSFLSLAGVYAKPTLRGALVILGSELMSLSSRLCIHRNGLPLCRVKVSIALPYSP